MEGRTDRETSMTRLIVDFRNFADTETFGCTVCESACDKVAFGLYSATSNDCSVSGYMSGGSIAVVVMKLN